MNGAESLVRTLVAGGVNVCFANPGTSEMHFVAALDTVPGMRCVLGLFEGVVTGAADGYYRMKGDVAATLLHLGPGLGNGLANLHNAKKARSGIVNLVGEHATYHLRHDAPLTADIVGVATPMSDWVHTATSAGTLAADAALAVHAARRAPGGIATLIAPADTAWSEAAGPAVVAPCPPRTRTGHDAVRAAVRALTRDGAMLMLGGAALRGRALDLAGRIAAKTGCRLMAEYNNARMEAGAGRPPVPRLPYVIANALAATAGVRELVLCGARSPVAFFAYPGKPSVLIGDDCTVTTLAQVADDLEHALDAVACELDALQVAPLTAERIRPPLPEAALNADTLAAVLAAHLPEHAIVCDESVSTGRQFGNAMRNAAPHDWLSIMGGSIGWALPAAVGAAIAAPERKVVALESDGSGMYTLQALWTMAREQLDVTVIVFANRAYQILRGEFTNVGAGAPGRNATDMLMLDRPDLDWCALARGMGVPAEAADTTTTFANALDRAFAERGPRLVVARM